MFNPEAHGSSVRIELLAGCTTWLTMAYIVVVNPSILAVAGIDHGAAFVATCISAAIGSAMMGIFADLPLALAPGMGLNAYFTYSVVKGMGVSWQVALGAVFVSGVAFLLLTAIGVRQLILETIPKELYASVAAGVGLFISFLGLRDAGVVVPNAATIVTIGSLRDRKTMLAIAGLVVMAALLGRGVKAAILIGVVGTTVAGLVTRQIEWQPQATRFSDLSATAFRLDLGGTP